MDSSKEIEDHSAELINLLDELKQLGYTDKDLEDSHGYTKKYLREQTSKAKRGTRNDRLIKNLTWIRTQILQKAKYYPGIIFGQSGKEFIVEYYESEAAKQLNQVSEVRHLIVSALFKRTQYVFHIADDAMWPEYPQGSTIGIREIPDKIIVPGNVYMVETANDLLVRRLYYKDNNQETNIFKLISDNSWKEEAGSTERSLVHPPFYIDIDTVRKLFKVTWIFKSNEPIPAEG